MDGKLDLELKFLWGESGEGQKMVGWKFYIAGRVTISFPLQNNEEFKMLYLIGLGLSDEADITVRGLAIVKKATRVYLEAYTSILLVDKSILVSCVIL